MKVPDSLIFSLFQEQDAKLRKKLSDKTLEISTGRKYMDISDDPPTTYDLLEIKKDISQLSQYSKNRLFADTSLSYVDFNLGKIEESLNFLYAKAIQAKNSVVQPEQLRAIGEVFSSNIRVLLDRMNDQIGGNYIFGGAGLTTKPFDDNNFQYKASAETFKVWLSDNYQVDVFLNGGEVFKVNVAISNATFTSTGVNFTTGGTISVTVGTTTTNINYPTTQTLNDLVNFINSNHSSLFQARVNQKTDGTYSLVLIPTEVSNNISVSDTTGGDFDVGSVDFYSPNMLEVVKTIGDKLNGGKHPDDTDLMLLQRSFDRVALRRSQVGSVLSQVKNLQLVYENLEDSLNKHKSDLEDVELSESIMEYTRYRIAYEALMRIIADQRDMSILRYIR
ncbi:MAG: flagellar hook-associated protein FlgL [Aquificaceae bacterium]|nr:flagellar hook-associated protein FlgL [Aquificaceae bacterium]